jgi:hypothetical protein
MGANTPTADQVPAAPTADHTLTVSINHGWIDWVLNCHHAADRYLPDGWKPGDPQVCEVQVWYDRLGTGMMVCSWWPDPLPVPCPVRPVWYGSEMALDYDVSAEVAE